MAYSGTLAKTITWGFVCPARSRSYWSRHGKRCPREPPIKELCGAAGEVAVMSYTKRCSESPVTPKGRGREVLAKGRGREPPSDRSDAKLTRN